MSGTLLDAGIFGKSLGGKLDLTRYKLHITCALGHGTSITGLRGG